MKKRRKRIDPAQLRMASEGNSEPISLNPTMTFIGVDVRGFPDVYDEGRTTLLRCN